MFMGRQTNNSNGVNVNTNLYSSYSDTARVTLGAWNQQLSLKIHPFKGVNADGVRQYASDNTEIINTSITVDNATALLEGIKKEVIPALKGEKGEFTKQASISMGAAENRKVLTILIDDDGDPALRIAVGVSESGIAADSNILTHKFNKKEYLASYDPHTGENVPVTVYADFENFVKKLESVYDLAPVVSHTINYNNAMKASFGNRNQAASNQPSPSSYSAPTTNFSGSDMGGFLPFN